MSLKKWIVIMAVLSCGAVLAQDFEDTVRRATEKIDKDYLEAWAFIETRTVDGEDERVASYDPARTENQRWQLLLVNGEPPDEKAIEEFQEEKAERRAEREENADEDGLWELIAPGSLELIEETAESWRFSFQPQDEEEPEFMENVAGEITVIKDGHYVGNMTMSSRRPFKPATGVKLNRFLTTLVFGPISHGGPIVPLSQSTSVSGKAFLVATIEENVVFEYTEYRQVPGSVREAGDKL